MFLLKFIPSFIVLLCLLASSIWAQDFNKGREAYDRGDFDKALQEWYPLAEQGHTEAQIELAYMYEEGQGVVQDYEQAAKWYRKAAEQGYFVAQHNLGVMYELGRGVQDYEQAAKWYRKAAEQGVVKSQLNLGLLYARGQGVVQDYIKALKWLNLAAAQGDENAKEGRGMVAENMTSDQISEAQRLAREWMEKHQDKLE